MREILLAVGGPGSGAFALLVATALVLLAALIGIAVLIARASRARSIEASRQTARAGEIEARMAELARIQADTAGRIHMLGKALGGRQAELSRVLAERLDAVTHRIGQSMETTTRHTVESLRHLHERLAVIDNAQKNLTDLSSQVTSLRQVGDIAERYLIPGETQETALMFVPSESVYAELYDGFDDVIQKAYRAQIVLVSPSLLMLAIQVMQQICKDARMRDAVQEIRTEVGHLIGDVDRLRERVLKLQQHFGQATDDVAQVLISADKITKRGGRI